MDATSQTNETGHAEMMANYNRLRDMLRGKSGRKIAGNTVIERVEFGHTIAITFWKTVILQAQDDGSLTLNSGGYKTVTTQARLNEYLPPSWRVHTEHGVWYLAHFLSDHGYSGPTKSFMFADGMVIDGNGDVRGAGLMDSGRAAEKLTKQINAYAKAYAETLTGGSVPAPDLGDCFYCAHPTDTSGTAIPYGQEHLLSHLEESYFVPSLLVNAMAYKGGLMSQVAREAVHNLWYGSAEDREYALGRGYMVSITRTQVAAVLKAYLRKELGLTS